MLGICMPFHHLNGKAMPSCRGKDIDPAGFHGRACPFGMPAALFKGAVRTKGTGACSESQGLFISGQKDLPFHLGGDFLGSASARFKKNGLLIGLQYPAHFFRGWAVGRAHQAGSIASAAKLSLQANPGGCFYAGGGYDFRLFRPKFMKPLQEFPQVFFFSFQLD